MPGMPACLYCGQDLAAPVASASDTVPRVSSANPLSRRRPRVDRAPIRWPRPPEALADAVLGALRGALPGLASFRRGDRKRALAHALAVASPLCIGAALWHSEWQLVAWLAAIGGWLWSAGEEATRAVDHPGRAGRVAGYGIAAALCFTTLGALAMGFQHSWPTVAVARSGSFETGVVVIDPAATPRVGDTWTFRDHARFAGPIRALQGDVVTFDGGRMILLAELEGRVVYRISPAASRGPVGRSE